MKKKLLTTAAACLFTMAVSTTIFAATAQDIINMNQTNYTAGTDSIYGPSLNQDQLNAVAQAAADFKTNYITDSMDNDTKIRTAYDYLVNKVSYIDWDKGEGANAAYGALVKNQAACSGYARAFKALCDGMNVSCYYIHAAGNDHQWNLVEFNDGFYFVDVQANDSSGFDWIYHSSVHPYSYDTTQFPAVGSKSGANTSGTTNTTTEGWKQDSTGWWYQNADGSYPVNTWKEISGAWYYFEGNGYMAANQWVGNYYVGSNGAMLTNTTTPDGYQVGADGAWIQGETQQNDGVHTKTFHNEDWSLSDSIEGTEIETRTDTNGNLYYVIPSTTTSITFLGNKSNLNPEQIEISFTDYKYNPETNTIYPFSNQGTAVYAGSLKYDTPFEFKIKDINLTGQDFVNYCKQNDVLIRVDISGISDNYGIYLLFCYE